MPEIPVLLLSLGLLGDLVLAHRVDPCIAAATRGETLTLLLSRWACLDKTKALGKSFCVLEVQHLRAFFCVGLSLVDPRPGASLHTEHSGTKLCRSTRHQRFGSRHVRVIK